MCGIAGIWYRDSTISVDPELLMRMAATIAYRGPDDSGVFTSGSFGMAHRRLSIIDLSAGGHQPMTTADGRFTLAFNGEIYNYRELKEEYLDDDKPKSKSDTEVLLLLLAKRGIAALSLLRGMFAIALWDEVRKELLLARDPYGKKPLFYTNSDDVITFASEPKALLRQHLREINPNAMTKYLMYEYPPAPASAFADIKQAPMGEYIKFTRTRVEIDKHWQVKFKPKRNDREAQLLTQLDELFHQSVKRRLIADVPIGLLLSGGLDSTTIGWYVAQHTKQPMHSFSISFEERSFDESSYAAEAAEHLNLVHHVKRFDLESFKQSIGHITKLVDMPLADASLLPTYEVCQLASQYVTVVLDGDGGDELLGGYGTFRAAEVAERLKCIPKPIITYMGKLIEWLPTSYQNFSLDFKVKSFFRGMAYPLARRNQIWLGSFTETELKELLAPKWQHFSQDVFSEVDILEKEISDLPVTDQISFLTSKHYLNNDILVKLDRAAMYTSLEARTPFLDIDLAEFIMRLPVRYKRKKYILKKLMRGRIPDAIIDRPKKGFGIPLGWWLRGPLYDWASETLNTENYSNNNYFSQHMFRTFFASIRKVKRITAKNMDITCLSALVRPLDSRDYLF